MTMADGTPRTAGERARRRAELWNVTFRTLYGPLRGEGVPGIAPAELPNVDTARRMTRRQLVARPGALRRLLAPLLVTGADAAYATDADFRELVVAAMRDEVPPPRSYADARERLVEYARERLGMTADQPVRPALHAIERLLSPEALLVVEPGTIVQREGVSTVSKRARFFAPFTDVRDLLDPRTWLDMGPFFDEVRAVPGEHQGRSDGWEGLFEEKFVIAWAELQVQTFHTFLAVDYTFDRERARADYALVYEVDDQLERDGGFIEARRIPGHVGWTEYYAEKSMRFRSPQANLLAPMIMSVFLESGLSAIEDRALEYRAQVRGVPVPGRAT